MKCYSCKTEDLHPSKLDFGLPALRCQTCQGTYLDLLTYRAWLEDVAEQIAQEQSQDMANDTSEFDFDELDNTENALVCQRCQKFMLKYRINNEQENTINVCHTCDDVWLDRGEWELLKYLKIQDKLTYVMSEPWQKDIRTQNQKNAFTERYQQILNDDFGKVDEFTDWLNQHPKKAEIKHYLLSKYI